MEQKPSSTNLDAGELPRPAPSEQRSPRYGDAPQQLFLIDKRILDGLFCFKTHVALSCLLQNLKKGNAS